MARVPYRHREDADEEDQAIFDRLETERRRPTSNIFLALAHAPLQLDGLLTYSSALRSATELGPRLRELVILSIASARGGDYIAAHHVADALNAGFSEEQIAAIGSGDEVGHFTDVELAVIRLSKAVGADQEVTPDLWDGAAQHLSHKQMVQLTLTATWYISGAILIRMLALDIEDTYKAP